MENQEQAMQNETTTPAETMSAKRPSEVMYHAVIQTMDGTMRTISHQQKRALNAMIADPSVTNIVAAFRGKKLTAQSTVSIN